ncbi:MAG: Crp/Fnr family transcriptional regulator, partial [Bacteroidota bacterium]
HYYSFIRQVPSFHTIQSLEPSIVATLSYQDIQTAYQTFPRFERYGRLIAEEVLVAQAKRIESFLFKTAEQRYLDFMR